MATPEPAREALASHNGEAQAYAQAQAHWQAPSRRAAGREAWAWFPEQLTIQEAPALLVAPLELKGSSVRSMQTSMAVMEDRLGHTDDAVAQLEGRVAKMEQQINGVLETQPLRAESVHEAMEP